MNPTPQSDSRAPLDEVGALLCRVAGLLYVNGQTTRNMVERVERLAHALGYSAECFPNWGEIVIRIAQSGESHAQKIVPVAGPPVGVDMNKVMKTVEVLDRVSTGRLDVRGAAAALKEIARLAPTSTLRFAALAGAGAAALGVIFGDARPFSLALIALSAAAGAVLRRFIATRGGAALAQVLGASLLAGLVAAGAVRFLGVADVTSPGLVPLYGADARPSFFKRGAGLRPFAHRAWASAVRLCRAIDIAHLRGAHRRPFPRPAKSRTARSGRNDASRLRRPRCRRCGRRLRDLLLDALARLTHSRRHRDVRSRFPMGRT